MWVLPVLTRFWRGHHSIILTELSAEERIYSYETIRRKKIENGKGRQTGKVEEWGKSKTG